MSGKADRKNAHLKANLNSEKSKRIKLIFKAGLNPIIKVIIKEVTLREAFLIE
jgi:hypothetical protein